MLVLPFPRRMLSARFRREAMARGPVWVRDLGAVFVVGDVAGHCFFVRGGESLDAFGGLFDQMARVSSEKAAITRSIVGSSTPSS